MAFTVMMLMETVVVIQLEDKDDNPGVWSLLAEKAGLLSQLERGKVKKAKRDKG